MKVFASFILCLAMLNAMAMQPDNYLDSTCRSAYEADNTKLPFSRQIELDLINGLWSIGDDLQVYFNADGTSDWLSKAADGSWIYEEKAWTVRQSQAGPKLELEAEGEFFIQPTCEGVSLRNAGEIQPIDLTYAPPKPEQYAQQVRSALVGDWEHTLTPKQIEELAINVDNNLDYVRAKVRIHFNENGSFAKALICPDADLRISETGTWKLSPDGAYLMLSGLEDEANRCLRLKYVEMDEMVIEQALAFIDRGRTTTNQDFYFNKH